MAGINGYTAGDITSKDFDKLIQDATKWQKNRPSYAFNWKTMLPMK